MDKPMQLIGRIWPITGADGELVDNIDTDMIFHNAHLAITEIEKMGPHAFGNLDGWKDFPAKVKPGDIMLVGENFGAGSSRQQAVDCFCALGVAAIVARSFGAIYKRNAINSGLPILEWPAADPALFTPGEEITLDLDSAALFKSDSTHPLGQGRPMAEVQKNIYQAGNLFEYGRRLHTIRV